MQGSKTRDTRTDSIGKIKKLMTPKLFYKTQLGVFEEKKKKAREKEKIRKRRRHQPKI